MPDFTLNTYHQLLRALQSEGFSFMTFREYILYRGSVLNGLSEQKDETSNLKPETLNLKLIVLRHDVDALPRNSLRLAQLEHSLGIRGTYYFRMIPKSFDEHIIREIATLGHEIGYHYETMATITGKPKDFNAERRELSEGARERGSDLSEQSEGARERPRDGVTEYRLPARTAEAIQSGGPNTDYPELQALCPMPHAPCSNRQPETTSDQNRLIDQAYILFVENLEKLRKVVPVETICMHGSPLFHFDNRAIWEKYDYHPLGIVGDPYFDVDFSKMAYLTDTGRRWNGAAFSIRDKINDYNTNRPDFAKATSGETRERGNDEVTERLRDSETQRQNDGVTNRGSERSDASTLLSLQEYDRRNSSNNFEPFELQTLHAPCSMPHAPCSMPHAPCSMPHAPCLNFRHTRDIISAVRSSTFPAQAMFTVHPQRWTGSPWHWTKELVWQNLKNGVKWTLLKVKREE